MSFFADKYGRRRTLLSCITIASISLSLIGFSTTIEMMMVAIFFSGFGMGGYETIIYAYVTEISGINYL